ncbi:hypothetical protein ACH427_16755 [Streptomyces sp. NPDC020379]|uniref:hypothetical protein n=1 Tax=Streptomyces sp. NPDC020379 TaxID=3365071 RepID=UPI0037965AA5
MAQRTAAAPPTDDADLMAPQIIIRPADDPAPDPSTSDDAATEPTTTVRAVPILATTASAVVASVSLAYGAAGIAGAVATGVAEGGVAAYGAHRATRTSVRAGRRRAAGRTRTGGGRAANTSGGLWGLTGGRLGRWRTGTGGYGGHGGYGGGLRGAVRGAARRAAGGGAATTGTTTGTTGTAGSGAGRRGRRGAAAGAGGSAATGSTGTAGAAAAGRAGAKGTAGQGGNRPGAATGGRGAAGTGGSAGGRAGGAGGGVRGRWQRGMAGARAALGRAARRQQAGGGQAGQGGGTAGTPGKVSLVKKPKGQAGGAQGGGQAAGGGTARQRSARARALLSRLVRARARTRLRRRRINRRFGAWWKRTGPWRAAARRNIPHGARVGLAGAASGLTGALLTPPGVAIGMLVTLKRLFFPRRGAGNPAYTWGPATARRIWARLYGRAQAKHARNQRIAAITGKVPVPVRGAAATVTAPATTTGGGAITPGGISAMSVLTRTCEDLRDSYTRYMPPSMMAVAAEYAGLPEGIRQCGQAVKALAINTDTKYPVLKPLVQALVGVYTKVMQAADYAEQINPQFRTVHADDLARHESPRNGQPGERMWNIGVVPGSGGTAFQPSHFVMQSQSVAIVYATYTPDDMISVGREYAGLPVALEAVSATVEVLHTRTRDSYPVDDSVTDMIATLARMLASAASEAMDVFKLFRTLHAKDLSRHENPRKGPASEAMWNV